MKQEMWSWTELLAFDCDSEDYGAGEYLDRAGGQLCGISLLLSGIDFVLLYDGMDREYKLFPDVCSRLGHEGNEERDRQEWTNYKLRGLIRELQRRGVKVFFSLFLYYLHDKFHHEYVTDHMEVITACRSGMTTGVCPVARMNDGTLIEDVFFPRLRQVMLDYGFDGWQGPDAQGPFWNIHSADASDQYVRQFAETLPEGAFDESYLLPAEGSAEKFSARLDYIWEHFQDEWRQYNIRRVFQFWKQAADTLHGIGKQFMMNTPDTHSVFEALQHSGMDYRMMRQLKVDYLLAEAVSTSMALFHGTENVLDYCGVIEEMRMVFPDTRILVLAPVKDVVERWDCLRHAPCRMERDFWLFANECVVRKGRTERSAAGMLVCCGDGISRTEWKAILGMFENCYRLKPGKRGRMAWLFVPEMEDELCRIYASTGNPPPYHMVSDLREAGLDIGCVCGEDDIETLDMPLLVPCFDLLPSEIKARILTRRQTTVLIGNFQHEPVPENASGVFCALSDNFRLGCVILNSGDGFSDCPAPAETAPFNPIWNYSGYGHRCPEIRIPAEFWRLAAAAIGKKLPAPALLNPEDGIREAVMESPDGDRQVALYSTEDVYVKPDYVLREHCSIERNSSFPYTPFLEKDGKLCGDLIWKISIPPRGMILFTLHHD